MDRSHRRRAVGLPELGGVAPGTRVGARRARGRHVDSVRRCGRSGSPRVDRGEAAVALALAQLADASLLADLAAQVVQLGAVDVADRADLDLVDLRRVERERALHAHAERVLADGERLARAAALPLDDDPLEHLDPRARAFDDAEMHAHRVARLEPRDFAQLTALDVLDDRAHVERGPEPRGMVAGAPNQRIVARSGGQYVAHTLPTIALRATVPQTRESQDDARLSPSRK